MAVILYMAATLNGIIARGNGKTDFVSKIEWANYKEAVKRTGNIVIGRKTYEVMLKGGEFAMLNNPRVVVATNTDESHGDKNILFTNRPLKDIIDMLKKEGFTDFLVSGGGELNSAFMKENLIDEIYIDIEPRVIGKGIRLFSEGDFEAKLELIEVKKLSEDEIQLHYRVKK